MIPDVLRRLFFRAAADFSDQDHRVRIRVFSEGFQGVDESGPDERIAADPDAGALPDAPGGELVHRLVGQGTAPGNASHPSRAVDVARHDPDLALPGRDDAGTVGTDEAGVPAPEKAADLQHVPRRDPLGDADHQLQIGVGRLQNGVGRKGGRHEDHAGVGSLPGSGFPNRVVDGEAVVPGASLAGSDACDHPGAVAAALGRMKAALTARDALNHDSGCRIHPDGHSTILR